MSSSKRLQRDSATTLNGEMPSFEQNNNDTLKPLVSIITMR